MCHTYSFTTPTSSIAALSKVQAQPLFGPAGSRYGPASRRQCYAGQCNRAISSAPRLCGASVSGIFFLHDGRTNQHGDQAIEDHFSTGNGTYPNSEANTVINNFNALSQQNQQDLVNFLRSL